MKFDDVNDADEMPEFYI